MSAAGRRNRTLTARDREICAAIGPTLREQGMIFVGIDVIGDWLTEINVTSPTGIQEIDRFDGVNIEAMIWDRIEARLLAAAISARVPQPPWRSQPKSHRGDLGGITPAHSSGL